MQLAVFLCGLYGGYFNAAMGLLLIAALSLVLDEPLRRIGALKNVFSAVVGVLGPATVVGGFAGAKIARRLPSEVLRWTIVGFAVVVAVVLFVT